MNIIDSILNIVAMNSVLLFVVIFLFMFGSSILGKHLFKKRHRGDERADDEAKIILGALLSLLFLLMGFILSIAIGGYNAREQTEEQEAIAIANASQNTAMLSEESQRQAYPLLQQYLSTRIAFFDSGTHIYSKALQNKSIEIQKSLWAIAMSEAKTTTVNGFSRVLSSYSELYNTQARTTAGWRDQILRAAWLLLIIFSIAANYLIGHNIRGLHGRNLLILTLPLLTTMALFMIAEIDVPGEGVIYVKPENLVVLQESHFIPSHIGH